MRTSEESRTRRTSPGGEVDARLLVRSTGLRRQPVEDTEQSGGTTANCTAAAGAVNAAIIVGFCVLGDWLKGVGVLGQHHVRVLS